MSWAIWKWSLGERGAPLVSGPPRPRKEIYSPRKDRLENLCWMDDTKLVRPFFWVMWMEETLSQNGADSRKMHILCSWQKNAFRSWHNDSTVQQWFSPDDEGFRLNSGFDKRILDIPGLEIVKLTCWDLDVVVKICTRHNSHNSQIDNLFKASTASTSHCFRSSYLSNNLIHLPPS